MEEHESNPDARESFAHLALVQAELERHGFFLQPVAKEHTEGLVTGPLVHRLQTHIRKRGFGKVAGHVAITFSGYGGDDREVYAIPEARAFWQALNTALPELPALLGNVPALGYNGPGMHLTMIGEIDEVRDGLVPGTYLAHVVNAEPIIGDVMQRIRAAGRKFHLPEDRIAQLAADFRRAAGQNR